MATSSLGATNTAVSGPETSRTSRSPVPESTANRRPSRDSANVFGSPSSPGGKTPITAHSTSR